MDAGSPTIVRSTAGSSATFTYKNLSLGMTQHAASAFIALGGLGWACVRYKLNAGFIVLFLLGFVIVASAWMGYFMVRRISISLDHTDNVFAGSPAVYNVQIKAPLRGGIRRNIDIYLGKDFQRVTLKPGETLTVPLHHIAQGRGRGHSPVFLLQTVQPFGLWRMNGLWQPTATHWVYPRPEANPPPASTPSALGSDGQRQRQGHDTVSGLRPYAKGDTMRQISWRAMARSNGHVMASKQLESHDSELYWLRDAEAWAGTLNTEAMLERLSAWVLEAHAKGLVFGLQIGARQIAPANSMAHLEECLQALASHEQDDIVCRS